MNRCSLAAALVLVVPLVAHAQAPSDIEQFASAFIEAEKAAWERGEFDALQALEHENVVYRNINGNVFSGWEGHRADIENAVASFDGAPITQEWKYLMGDGNIFAVSYVWTIHYADTPLEITGIAVCRVENGKLVEEWGAGYEIDPESTE